MYLISFSYCLTEDFWWSKVMHQCPWHQMTYHCCRPSTGSTSSCRWHRCHHHHHCCCLRGSASQRSVCCWCCCHRCCHLVVVLIWVLGAHQGLVPESGGKSRKKSTSTVRMPTKRFSVSHKNILWNQVLTDAFNMYSFLNWFCLACHEPGSICRI